MAIGATVVREGPLVKTISDLNVKLFADGADKSAILELYRDPRIRGFTTNPTLMRQAGVQNYAEFAQEIVAAIPDRPISFEVFGDDLSEMAGQARTIASWGENVYVKIPVTNTRRESSSGLIRELSSSGVKLNVTAIMTLDQVEASARALSGGAASCISVFAGRIADTGRDPVPMVREAVRIVSTEPQIEIIWASPREILNIFHAEEAGCHIITVTRDVLKKLDLLGKDLDEYSLETVKMFYRDGQEAQYTLPAPAVTAA